MVWYFTKLTRYDVPLKKSDWLTDWLQLGMRPCVLSMQREVLGIPSCA